MAGLSVVIPTLEEASRLPLLLADLQSWPGELQVIVCDGGSRDQTRTVARLAGATVLDSPSAGRGPQLRWGVDHSRHDWVLVLHADSRLHRTWHQSVGQILRSRWLQRPYGDQGLLIHNQLYQRIGGYRPLALMEDLDLVERLSKVTTIRSLNRALLTSAERWQQRSVLMQAWRNARLRQLWRQGISPDQLLRRYQR